MRNDYYDHRNLTISKARSTRDIQLVLSGMNTRDEVRFGRVTVTLHLSATTVRFRCVADGKAHNFKYSPKRPEDYWDYYNPIEARQDCLNQTVAFILSRLPREGEAVDDRPQAAAV